MQLERISNVEVSLSEKLRMESKTAVAYLCVFAGMIGLITDVGRHSRDPLLAAVSVLSVFYGVAIDALPKQTVVAQSEKGPIVSSE